MLNIVKHHETPVKHHETPVKHHETLVKHPEPLVKHEILLKNIVKHHETLTIRCDNIGAWRGDIGAQHGNIGAEFRVISAIAVLVLLCTCVTEFLIMKIWVLFPDLSGKRQVW